MVLIRTTAGSACAAVAAKIRVMKTWPMQCGRIFLRDIKKPCRHFSERVIRVAYGQKKINKTGRCC